MNYWGGKNILVTGASGLIGSNLMELLRKQKASVIGTYFQEKRNSLDGCFKCDLRNKKDCKEAVSGQEIVFHCAAVSEGAKTMSENMLKLVGDNVIMNVNLLEASYQAGVKLFVFISSTTVNHLKEYRGVADVKEFTERLCELYNQKGMKCVVIRPTNVFGPGDKFDDRAHTIPMFIKRALNYKTGDKFTVWGDGTQRRNFIYVKDLANLISRATIIESLKSDTRPVTLGSKWTKNVDTVAYEVFSAIGKEMPLIEHDLSKPTILKNNEPHCDYIVEKETDFEQAIKETIHWYQGELHG